MYLSICQGCTHGVHIKNSRFANGQSRTIIFPIQNYSSTHGSQFIPHDGQLSRDSSSKIETTLVLLETLAIVVFLLKIETLSLGNF
jgi:hypothetical protein